MTPENKRALATRRLTTDIAYMQKTEKDKVEKAVLVGLARKSNFRQAVEESLDELAELAISAGGHVEERFVQVRNPDPKFYIGKGMVEQIRERIEENGSNLVIFDDLLSPAQQRNLEQAFNIKVIDRSILILDIFALHARSAAAKLQVELAQLEYMLPRLTGAWSHFSKQYGGIGTKGPGETQLEIDRRQVRTRISKLKKELVKLGRQRDTQRKNRQNLFKVALIGYTNAGKSTLFNRLTKSDVKTENALFTTLDSTTRMMTYVYPQKILFTDTVGFIKKLPHQLIESFKSTLEEVVYADLLLHIIDYTDENSEEKIEQTEKVLRDIGANHIDKLLIFNKIDKSDDLETMPDKANAFFVSALEKTNLKSLKEELSARLTLFSQKHR